MGWSPPDGALVLFEQTPALDGLVAEDDEKGEGDGLDEARGQRLGEDAEVLLVPEVTQRLHERAVLHLTTPHHATVVIIIIIRGGTIHRCIDIAQYFSHDTYRDIIFYDRDFYIYIYIYIFFSTFRLGRKDT